MIGGKKRKYGFIRDRLTLENIANEEKGIAGNPDRLRLINSQSQGTISTSMIRNQRSAKRGMLMNALVEKLNLAWDADYH